MILKLRRLPFAVLAGVILALGAHSGAGAVAQPERASGPEVVVEVSGAVPGFADPRQLAGFLADRMEGAAPAWHFLPGQPGQEPPLNRVEWKFKTLKVIWGGGAHQGFPQETVTRSYLSAEVRLYLNDQYQTTMLSQPTVVEGPDDTELASMVTNVAHSLATLVEADKRPAD